MFSTTVRRFFVASPTATQAAATAKTLRPTGNFQWMPTLPLILLHATNATPTQPAQAIFRIQPKMTKHEVKEYLTKIYKLPVVTVRTQNYLGKRMRIIGKRSVAYGKRPDYKKAFVTFDNTLADVGLGSRVDGTLAKGEEGGQ
jgi:large subunit ribosomal protein L23